MRTRATTTRWPAVVGAVFGAVVVAASLAGCSGGSGASSPTTKSGKAPACATIAKLDEIARGVGQADVHDPVAFNKTFTKAVHDYVANLRRLRGEVPAELGPELDRVLADVQQYRFDSALTDRSGLDAYASRTCGRIPAGLTTTTIAGLPTTTVAGATTTTSASGSTTTGAGDSTTSSSVSNG